MGFGRVTRISDLTEMVANLNLGSNARAHAPLFQMSQFHPYSRTCDGNMVAASVAAVPVRRKHIRQSINRLNNRSRAWTRVRTQ